MTRKAGTQFNYRLAFRLALLSNAFLLGSGLLFLFNSTVVATAPSPPRFEVVPSGNTGVDYNLYITRTSDSVNVFCYPGYRARLSNVGTKQAIQCNQPIKPST